jgi:hypothetical protein
VGDDVVLALVVAVPVCVDGVGLAGFVEVQPATTARTLTSASTTHIIATFRIMRLTSWLVRFKTNKHRDIKRSNTV